METSTLWPIVNVAIEAEMVRRCLRGSHHIVVLLYTEDLEALWCSKEVWCLYHQHSRSRVRPEIPAGGGGLVYVYDSLHEKRNLVPSLIRPGGGRESGLMR